MSLEFKHISVLLDESIKLLEVKPNGIYVDGTLGGGGHSELICSKLGDGGRLIGIDRDEAALRAAGATFEGEGTTVKENPVTHVDLLDLGLIGAGSKAKRAALLRALALPEHLSTAALLDVLGTLTTREELVEECNKIVANRE